MIRPTKAKVPKMQRAARNAKRGKAPPPFVWRQVRPARAWLPKEGQALVGVFLGFAQRNGRHGAFQAAKVRGLDGWVRTVAGVEAIRLFESVEPGTTIKIRYEGRDYFESGAYRRKYCMYQDVSGLGDPV